MTITPATRASLAVAVLFASFASAEAAFITVDDSDLNTITITAGDFEGGFSVDGVLLTSGLGNSASLTLPDEGYTLSGTWIDHGDTVPGGRVDLVYSLAGNPAFITSGIELEASSDGRVGTLDGTVGGYTAFAYYASAADTLDQSGGVTGHGALPFLSVAFVPEMAAVPEPTVLGLVGSGLAALVAARRRRR